MLKQYWLLCIAMFLLVGCGTVAPIATPAVSTQVPVLDPTPAAPPSGDAGAGGATGVAQPLVTEALAQVSKTTGIPIEELEITATEAVEWPNSALGCPTPGQMYLDVITPGFRIEIRAGDELFDVGTNLDGTAIAVCPRSQ